MLPPVTDDLVKPMLMFKAVIKNQPPLEFPRSPTVVAQMRTTSSTLCDQASYPSNEKEMSHGRVSWRTHWTYFAMGLLASSIG